MWFGSRYTLVGFWDGLFRLGLIGPISLAKTVPVVVFGLNWRRATARAAVAAIVTSLVLNFAVEIFSIRLPFGISGPLLAMVTSMTLFMTVSLIDREPELDEDIEQILKL